MTPAESWRERFEKIWLSPASEDTPKDIERFIAQELKAAVGMIQYHEPRTFRRVFGWSDAKSENLYWEMRREAEKDLETAKAKVLKELGV